MARNNISITNLVELRKHINLFVDEELSKPIEDLMNYDSEQIDLSGYDESIKTNIYKITFSEGLKSIKAKSDFFTNHINNNNKNSIFHDQILNILKLENSEVELEDLPFDIYDEVKSDKLLDQSCLKKPEKVERYNRIFSIIGINVDDSIIKTPYKSSFLKQFNKTEKGDLFRVYYQKNIMSNVINIVLLDIHHLLATSVQEYKKKYRPVKNYNCCIRQLLK